MAQPASPSDTKRRLRSDAVSEPSQEALLAPKSVPKKSYKRLLPKEPETDDTKVDEQPEINSVSDIDPATPSPSPQQPKIRDTFDLVSLAIEVFKDILSVRTVHDDISASDVEAC